VDKSAAGALDIADKETLTQGDNGLNWKNEDQLFISIMQNYYLPEVQKITADDIKVVRRQGEDNNTKNYFEVTYTDENGNKQTKFYNYVMDDKQTSKDNIVIFEKRIEEVNWKTAQETNPDQYVKENGDTITVSEVEKGLKDGTIIAVDGKKVIKNDGTESIIISDNNQKTENGEVDTDVNEATEKESWKLDENGNLIKTVTADVTTITYTDAKFTSTEQYQTEAERDAAAATIMAFLVLLFYIKLPFAGITTIQSWSWIESIGLDFAFRLDGLSLLFSCLILGIGLLIIIYARYYISTKDCMGRFYSYLLLFMGSMLGIVLSENIIQMVVFWELTSLSSFLLISYWQHKKAQEDSKIANIKITKDIRDAIINNIKKEELRNLVYDKDNTKTLLEDGLVKIINGSTTIEEVVKVIDLDTDFGENDVEIRNAFLGKELKKDEENLKKEQSEIIDTL
jgi:hypothetical protein